MKLWLFALVQSLIALVGVTACFYAEIPTLAAAAAVLAVVVAIAQLMFTSQKRRPTGSARSRQNANSRNSPDDRANETPANAACPPLPHRATVEALCREASSQTADVLLARYDEVIAAIEAHSEDAERGADCLAPDLPSEALGQYLCGLGALAQENDEAARDYFAAATRAQSTWAEAWHGWAAACSRLEEFSDLYENHPRNRGVDLLPFDCGNERIAQTLSAEDRSELTARFKQSAAALGSLHATAKKAKSRGDRHAA
jgi:hypothetical protein